MIRMKSLRWALGSWCGLCIIGLGTHSTGFAAPLTWTVSGTFDNGSTLSGTFNYDASTNAVSQWNLKGGSSYNYTPADSVFNAGTCCTDQMDFIFSTFDSALTLDFAFNPDLTNSGGTSTIAGGGEVFQLTDRVPVTHLLTGGSATTNPVVGPTIPEPGTSPYLCLAGLLAGGVLLVRRRATVSGALESGNRPAH